MFSLHANDAHGLGKTRTPERNHRRFRHGHVGHSRRRGRVAIAAAVYCPQRGRPSLPDQALAPPTGSDRAFPREADRGRAIAPAVKLKYFRRSAHRRARVLEDREATRSAARRSLVHAGPRSGSASPKSSVITRSGTRVSNSRPSAWEADALPTELVPRQPRRYRPGPGRVNRCGE
jgi:hypothetical protein